MLSHISIKDFAIIDYISLDLHKGFNIITGETGAGKSIIIEAVSMALGSRADTAFVRTGKEKAVIELTVNTDDKEIIALLDENGLEYLGDIQITREIHANGKSVCRVNGDLVSVSFLNKLCRKIADIHGQYDHQSLLNPEHHIFLIDEYNSKTIFPLKEKVKELYEKYSQTRNKINSLIKNREENERKRDFLKFESEEILSANLRPGEDEVLASRLLLLQNSEKIYQNLSAVYEMLFEITPSCQDNLGNSTKLLREIQSFSDALRNISDEVSECYYQLEDLKSEIRRARDSVDFSLDLLNETVERIDLIDRLKRKYGGSIEKILDYQSQIADNLNQIENSDILIEKLSIELTVYHEELTAACRKLTEERMKAARDIEFLINNELNELNFKDASLSVYISQLSGSDGILFTENGTDHAEFLIVTNKGEAPKPLSKIASGGEISRIMLAFKRIIGDYDHIPTMIFDEIDSGISGITASIVGKKLKDISENHQILCITHLPQIASYSDNHYMIFKENTEERTITKVVPLDEQGKINEIARLLGGMNITDTTLKNAKELISQSV